jgi:Toprim-like
MIEANINPNEELHFFKSRINLANFLENEFGFEVKSSKEHSYVMRRDDLEVYVSLKNGIYVYKSFQSRHAQQQGTIIDFLSINTGESLGRIRTRLRPLLSLKSHHEKPVFRQNTSMFRAISSNALPAVDQFNQAAWDGLSEYKLSMLNDRGITSAVIEMFDVRVDERKNACFGHRDRNLKITGFERVNNNFKGFCGRKSLMLCGDVASAKRIIVTESSIDAMSYMQLNGRPGDLYVSMSGKASRAQLEELFSVTRSNKALLICAHDADEAGDEMANEILAKAPGVRHRPENCVGIKDWNDVLKKMLKAH